MKQQNCSPEGLPLLSEQKRKVLYHQLNADYGLLVLKATAVARYSVAFHRPGYEYVGVSCMVVAVPNEDYKGRMDGARVFESADGDLAHFFAAFNASVPVRFSGGTRWGGGTVSLFRERAGERFLFVQDRLLTYARAHYPTATVTAGQPKPELDNKRLTCLYLVSNTGKMVAAIMATYRIDSDGMTMRDARWQEMIHYVPDQIL